MTKTITAELHRLLKLAEIKPGCVTLTIGRRRASYSTGRCWPRRMRIHLTIGDGVDRAEICELIAHEVCHLHQLHHRDAYRSALAALMTAAYPGVVLPDHPAAACYDWDAQLRDALRSLWAPAERRAAACGRPRETKRGATPTEYLARRSLLAAFPGGAR